MTQPLTYEPVILISIELDSATKYVATKDYYYSGQKYMGCVAPGSFNISFDLPDMFWGIGRPAAFQFRMLNVNDGVNDTWDEIAASDEFRGRWCKVERYDPTDGLQFLGYGRISEVEFDDEVTISVSGKDPVLDKILTRHTVTTDLFHATALDLGRHVPLCFGHCYDVFLPCIRNDTTNNFYDYLIGYGTIEGLFETYASNLGVRRDGRIVNPDEYSIYDGAAWIRGAGATVYPGYAFIRFTREQVNFSGGHHRITADVKGLELGGATANRSFITCIQNLLTNATWGADDDIDAATFAAAAAVISTANGFYCDGAVTEERRLESILMDMLFPARAYLERGSDGEWEITVDQDAASVGNFGDADGRYENVRVGGVRCISADQIVTKVSINYDIRTGA